MNCVSPQDVGISPKNIDSYVRRIENTHLVTHGIIMAKGDSIFFEKYWSPFDKDFKHRMYSVSKSFTALAIGFLLQDGKLSLDDTMEMHFPNELKNQRDENMRKQTVRDMLTMQTAKPTRNWFRFKPEDRVKFYFENDLPESRPAGTIFNYDSEGSFILCALAERITGKPFMDYLNEKLFSKIGIDSAPYCLKCPGGHSWGDSGVMCTPRDLLKVARFVMNGGRHNGEQILDEKFLNLATSDIAFNNYLDVNSYDTQGYGFKFWKSYNDSFFFNGMGSQFALCVPNKDLILIYNGDNQGKELYRACILDGFFELIADEKAQIPYDGESLYIDRTENFKLASAVGNRHCEFEKEINGVTYELNYNPMKIKKIKLSFDGDKGTFAYTNAQGEKEIHFGMCENLFGKFPQEGYSNEIGSVGTKDFYYDCAASAAWVEPQKLYIKIQIIDRYFGNMSVTVGFKGDECGIYMEKYAEDFLDEYCGFAGGKRAR